MKWSKLENIPRELARDTTLHAFQFKLNIPNVFTIKDFDIIYDGEIFSHTCIGGCFKIR